MEQIFLSDDEPLAVLPVFDRTMQATLLTKAFSLFERLAWLSIHVQMAFKRALKVINKAKQWKQLKLKFPGWLCFVLLFPSFWLRHEKNMAAETNLFNMGPVGTKIVPHFKLAESR